MSPPIDCSRPATLRLNISCELTAVRPAAEAAHQFLAGQGWPASEVIDCELALVEACNNAIKYASNGGRERPVTIDLLCGTDSLELRVTDHTPGFEWPQQIKLPDRDSESGRGLYLICTLMDEARYLRGPGENVLVLRRKLRR